MIEVLVASVLLIVGAFATLSLLDTGARATSASQQRDVANALVQEVVERSVGGRYTTTRNDMTDVDGTGAAATGPADRLRTAMGDATTPVSPATVAPTTTPTAPVPQSWSLTRSGTTFRVTYTACTTSDRIDGVAIGSTYDCNGLAPPAGGGGQTPTIATSNGCTVGAVPPPSGSPVGVTLQLLGQANLATCLGLGGITNALAPALCSLAPSGVLGSAVTGFLGTDGLLGDLASVGAGASGCTSLVEPPLRGPAAGIATTTRLSVSVAWTDRSGTAQRIDRTSVARRPTGATS